MSLTSDAHNAPAPRRPRRHAYSAPSWAAENRVGDVGSKAVLLLLANYADEEYSCYPGQQRLADETEQSVRQVGRQLAYLEALGLITRARRAGGQGHRTSDRFHLMLDVVIEAVAADDPRRGLLQGTRTLASLKPTPTCQTGTSEMSGESGSYLPVEEALSASGGSPTCQLLAEELPGVNSQVGTPRSKNDAPTAVVAIRETEVAVLDDPKARALAVAQRWWEGLGQKPIGRGAWHALLAVCEAGIKGGHSQQAVYDALLAVGAVPTIDRMDRILRGVASQSSGPQGSTTDKRVAAGFALYERLRSEGQ